MPNLFDTVIVTCIVLNAIFFATQIMIINLSCTWNDRWQVARMEDFSNGFNGLSCIFRTCSMNDEFDSDRYGRHVEGAFYVAWINFAFCTIFTFLTCLPPFTKASF